MPSLLMSGNTIRKAAVRGLGVAGAVGLLMFAMACGSGGNTPLPPPVGNFSNASLSGQYAYSVAGNQLLPDLSGNSNYYVSSGVFTADGAGNITDGIEDFAQSSTFGSNDSTGVSRNSVNGARLKCTAISVTRRVSRLPVRK